MTGVNKMEPKFKKIRTILSPSIAKDPYIKDRFGTSDDKLKMLLDKYEKAKNPKDKQYYKEAVIKNVEAGLPPEELEQRKEEKEFNERLRRIEEARKKGLSTEGL